MGIGEQFEFEKTGRIEPGHPIVLNTSDEAAKFVTGISGWVDRHGRFFGKAKNAEEMARWSGCTHIVCPDCGEPTLKSYTICHNCREENAIKRYEAKGRKQWDGETPLYSDFLDKYFFSENGLSDFMEDCRCTAESLRLIICKPIHLRQIDTDYFCDELADDGELPEAVIDALNDLNAVIRNEDPVSWEPGKYAADLTLIEEETNAAK